jgi:hypothetical protein
VPCCGGRKLLLLIVISVLLQVEGASYGAPQAVGDTTCPSSRPQEGVEADRGAVSGQGDDAALNPAGDRPKAIEGQGNEV